MKHVCALYIRGILGGLAVISCDGWYCDDPDWCEGNEIWGCVLSDDYDDHNFAEASAYEKRFIRDCSAFGQTCTANSSDAKCVWKDIPCAEDKSAFCEESVLKRCFAGYLSSEDNCAERDTYCVEKVDTDGEVNAVACSSYADSCNEEGEMSCMASTTESGTGDVVVCEGEFWSHLRSCYNDSVCVVFQQEDPPRAECTLSATPCAEEAQSICFDEQKLADCTTGYPVLRETCFNGCTQLSDTEAACRN